MSETHTVHDPFLNKEVEISSKLTNRLRGRYACGPTLPSGEPEFGWRQHDVPPIQKEAADEIDRLRATLTKIQYLEASDADTWIWQAQEEAREALAPR